MGTVKQQQSQASEPEQSAGDTWWSWWEAPSDLSQLQREDITLQTAFDKITEIDGVSTGVAPSFAGESYLLRKGLLYHQPEGGAAEQLVVPQSLREKVLTLVHSIPWQVTWAVLRL